VPVGLTIAIVADTAINVAGHIQAGRAAKKAGEYNAQVAELQAQDALDRGKVAEGNYRQGVKVLEGSQTADFAGQNVDVGTGSPVDVKADTAYLGELDAQQIRLDSQREAWGYKVQAQQSRMAGNQAATAQYYGAAGSALSGATTLLGAKYGFGSGGTRSTSPRTSPGNKGRFS
jgi:hypothetical protein